VGAYDNDSSVAGTSYADDDGLDDMLVAGYDSDEIGEGSGAVYLILGKSLGERGTADLSRADYKFIGEAAGIMTSGVGDVDGDGLDDIVVGAWYGPTWRGAAYVITGESAENIGCEWGGHCQRNPT